VFLFAGAPAGNYTVTFYNDNVAASVEDVVLRVETYVSSLSTTSISPYGGTTLTITGANFVGAIRDYKVIFKEGNVTEADFARQDNCSITAKTATTLTCTARISPVGLSRPDAQYNVYVVQQSKSVAGSYCTGGPCAVSYPANKTPRASLTSGIRATPGATYSLTGSNFVDSANPSTAPQVWIGSTSVTVAAFDATTINFTWPALQSGSYPSYVVGPYNSGRSNSWTTVYAVAVDGINVTTGSINGHITCLNGRGLRPTTATNVTLKVTGSTVVTSKQRSFGNDNEALCVEFFATTPSTAKNVTVTVNYNYNGSAFEYFYIADYSKRMTLAAVDSDAEEAYQSTAITSLDFVVTTTLALTGITPTHVSYYTVGSTTGTAFSTVRSFPVTWDATTNTSSVTMANFNTLKGSSYCFHLYVPTIGYTECARFKVTPPALGDLTIPTIVASYMGGTKLDVTGSSLANTGTLYVGSIKAPLDSETSTVQTFSLPGTTF